MSCHSGKVPQAALAEQFVAAAAPISPAVARLVSSTSTLVDVSELEEIVGTDPELSLRVLSLANSAFYSQRYAVTTLRGALIALGSDIVHRVASHALARSLLSGADDSSQQIWRHSQAVGVTARLLADRHKRVDSEQAFVAGLLHDIGSLALVRCEPERYSEFLDSANSPAHQGPNQERAFLGVSHAELGSEIAEILRLPSAIVSAIRGHHDPVGASGDDTALTVSAANTLANECGFAFGADRTHDEAAFVQILQQLGLSEGDVDALTESALVEVARHSAMMSADERGMS